LIVVAVSLAEPSPGDTEEHSVQASQVSSPKAIKIENDPANKKGRKKL
jgi:hypothetical protein